MLEEQARAFVHDALDGGDPIDDDVTQVIGARNERSGPSPYGDRLRRVDVEAQYGAIGARGMHAKVLRVDVNRPGFLDGPVS